MSEKIRGGWRLVVLFLAMMAVAVWPAAAQDVAPAAAATPPATGHEALGGIWELDQSQSSAPVPGGGGGDDSSRAGRTGGRRGGGGGRGGGRGGGGGGFGGGLGGRGGRAGGNELDPERAQAAASYVRALLTPSARLIIVSHDASFSIMQADGTRETLQIDNKKSEERAENGLVKLTRQMKWDGPALLMTINVDAGPKIERRYELSPGGTELHVVTDISGGRARAGGGKNTQVYRRPPEPVAGPAAAPPAN